MSIVLKNISYIHADRELLFEDIHLILNKGEKCALVGKNGCGKSTLLKIIKGIIPPSSGEVIANGIIYFVPQHFGQYDELTVSETLKVEQKIKALHAILEGDTTEENFTLLDDDWNIEEKCRAALDQWGLSHITLDHPMKSLSGGEKTKVFLSGIHIYSPEMVLMDEPTNHLDRSSRQKIYDFISQTNISLLIVSHDRELLNLLNRIIELTSGETIVYSGNYDFYKEEKEKQVNALIETIEDREKALLQARKIARETIERKNKLDARGKKLSEKKGVSRMAMNTLQDKAEKSTSKIRDVHENKREDLSNQIKELYKELPDNRLLKIQFNSPQTPRGKKLVLLKEVNFGYQNKFLWKNDLSFDILSGERICIQGDNGSGKTTLLKLITHSLLPQKGEIIFRDPSGNNPAYQNNWLYIDQDYSLINNQLNVYEQVQSFNKENLQEHELKMLLARFLFPYDTWTKNCSLLSGGEKMRLLFCCVLTSTNTPEMILLDEPTNNLDIQSIEIITSALQTYEGTLLVISHDKWFINEMNMDKIIKLQ